jgi:hypothetical protein
MNYGYQQPGGMMQGYAPQPPMMPGSGYGAPMMTNFQNTTADVEAQRKRLKALGLDDTMIDDALSFKQGLFEKRDEMQGQAMEAIGSGLKSAGTGIANIGSAASAGLKGLASSL